MIRSLDKLKNWLNGEEIYLVIDEAHHAVAKSYKKIIQYVADHTKSMKLLGLTATPFRTSFSQRLPLLTATPIYSLQNIWESRR